MRKFLVLITTFFISLPAIAQNVDIMRIYELFVASNSAAKTCSESDEATKRKFLRNFTAISLRAAMAFKERNPGRSEQELISAFNDRTRALRSSVEEDIKKVGCASPKATQLLKLYKMNAEFKLP